MPDLELLRLSAEIVAAHVAHNTTNPNDVPDLIRSVYAALDNAGTPASSHQAPQEPAVSVKKSVFPGYIVCLEDGKKLKMLKRHLNSAYGMTPDAYRAKWGLPASYPMVAPDYAMQRSALARSIGLGRKRTETPDGETETPVRKIAAGVRGKQAAPKDKLAAD